MTAPRTQLRGPTRACDVLQFGGQKEGAHNIGSAAHAFSELAFALAVMAFVPGGVSFAGRRYAAPLADRGYEPA